MNLQGLTINFLGDSITEGVSVEDIANNRYDNILKTRCGLKEVRNYGVGGTRIAHQFRPSAEARWDLNFCGRAEKMNPEADVVIVYGGTNDYGHGDAPFGKPGDSDRGTFCGAVRWLMERLTNMYPDAKIVFMTPARRQGDLEPSTSIHRYYPGLPLKAYVDVIKETARDFSIDVLDLYTELGIDPNGEEDRNKYTADGLHFNDAGHHVIAGKLQAFLQAL
ncbi:MAG: SGNH/GDSL hydrolase family protein [Ruminococcaceae bacterium]|nr:SGNH/GDSL hydrolase family protein [Oscillospiraceae bacterium]